MKNEIMPYVLIIVILAAFIAVLSLAILFRTSSQSSYTVSTTIGPTKPLNVTNYVTISASGTVSNSSTQAIIYIDINSTGKTSNVALKNLYLTTKQFNTTIYPLIGGNTSQISTIEFNVYKPYNSSNFTATESFSVNINNVSNVSTVIGSLSEIPNLYITSATSKLSDTQISSMRVRALQLAKQNATQQAQAVVGNGKITAANITVDNYYFRPYAYDLGVASSAPGTASTTITVLPTFYGGTSQVTENINVVFSYKNGTNSTG